MTGKEVSFLKRRASHHRTAHISVLDMSVDSRYGVQAPKLTCEVCVFPASASVAFSSCTATQRVPGAGHSRRPEQGRSCQVTEDSVQPCTAAPRVFELSNMAWRRAQEKEKEHDDAVKALFIILRA